ncbi:MAG: hypothetical protein AABW67_04960 [Nanoarchaeota archaeon]
MLEIREAIDEYLTQRNWNAQEEGKKTFYYKDRNLSDVRDLEFLTYSKRKKPLSMQQFTEDTKNFFLERGFSQKVLNSVINPEGDTIFIVAGVQYLSDFLKGRKEGNGIKYFIPQPVIRTKYRDSVGEGSVSSFVNLSTAQIPSSSEMHLSQIDDWMNYLSKLGLNLKDFILRFEETEGENFTGFWSNAKGSVLTFDYGGLEVGDAGYLQVEGRPFISDIGFGLERLLWAVNKCENFADLIGPRPFAFGKDYQLIDSVRTATLISLSGLDKKEEEPLRQFQIYLNNIKDRRDINLYDLVRHYYTFWERFVTPPKGFDETYTTVMTELNKQRNLELLNKLGFKKIPKILRETLSEDSDKVIQELINSSLISEERIKRLC